MSLIKKSDEDGFALLEGMVSLSLLSLYIIVIIPFFVGLTELKSEAKMELEYHRFLYESSYHWTSGSLKADVFTSNGLKGHSKHSNKTIQVFEGDHVHATIGIVSVEWKE